MDFGLTAVIPELHHMVPFIGLVDLRPAVISLIIFVVLIAAFRLLQRVVVVRLEALSKKTSTDLDDAIIGAISGIRFWVLVIVALYIALQQFAFTATVWNVFAGIALFAMVWQGIEVALKFVQYFAERILHKDEDQDGEIDPGAATASDMVVLLARIVLWALGILFVLSNVGIEVTSLLAGLGIGGVAVAFALQGILSDLFSSFSIYFDKPFRVGDYIVIGQHDGVVEKIGIKTTRIRTLQGEELVVSNAELTTTRIQNFKKMSERRVTFEFGVLYETPHELVKEIPKMLERIYTSADRARFERAHFTAYGDSGLIFTVVYYVESPEYDVYLDVQQKTHFDLMDKFAELGIEFAYPTQTVHVKREELTEQPVATTGHR